MGRYLIVRKPEDAEDGPDLVYEKLRLGVYEPDLEEWMLGSDVALEVAYDIIEIMKKNDYCNELEDIGKLVKYACEYPDCLFKIS